MLVKLGNVTKAMSSLSIRFAKTNNIYTPALDELKGKGNFTYQWKKYKLRKPLESGAQFGKIINLKLLFGPEILPLGM